jgi:multiple antibiotic resistance protein
MVDTILTSFITFFTVIDPIGTIPVFIAVTSSVNKNDRKKIAFKAAIVAAGVLLFFIVLGELILF